MRKYVYIIDYKDQYGADQMECNTIDEVIRQLRYLKKDNAIVENVKRVDNDDRWCEECISIPAIKSVIRVLGYKPIFIFCNG